MTEMEQYFTAILDNKIIACDKMKKAANMILNRLYNPGQFHFDPDIANRHINFMETFCKLPSGKANTPLRFELFQKARLQTVFGFVDDDDLRQYREVFIVEGRKNGKALALDTEIPTPSGWRFLKDIHVGDEVFTLSGRPARVVLESEIFRKPMYEVEFEDGSVVKASADHLWTVQSKYSKRRVREGKAKSPWYVTDTESLSHDYFHRRSDGRGTEYRYRVPMQEAVEYTEKQLPIDPYLLGLWIGNGTCGKNEITVNEDDILEILQNLSACGYTLEHFKFPSQREGTKAVTVKVDRHSHKNTSSRDSSSFWYKLRELGILCDKHIPRIYLESSYEQRMQLLKGLMDSDGYCGKNGEVEFMQKRERIIDEVVELVSSLGIKTTKCVKRAKLYGKDCGDVYRVQFFVPQNRTCFSIQRKTNRLKKCLSDRMGAKSIVRITPIPIEESKCIGVDDPSHIFLFGRQFTATHNTTEVAAVELDLLINDGEFAPQVYNCANKLDQSKLGFNACLKMVRQSPALSKHVRKRAADLYFEQNFGILKALSAESSTMDGLDVSGACMDEIGAATSRAVMDLILQAVSARKQPLIFSISTSGFVRGALFDQMMDYSADILDGTAKNERFLPFIYELDGYDEWDKEECWQKSNPGLGTIKSVDYLRETVQKAKDDPSFKPSVLIKEFNLKQTGESSWLRWEDFDNDAKVPDHPFRYGIAGFDAADSVDLTAAKIICMRPDDPNIYVKSMYWLPQKVLDEYERLGKLQGRDNVPYQLWKDKGYLRTVDSNVVDKRVVLDWFEEVREKEDIWIKYVGYDPWHMWDGATLREFKTVLGENTMVPVRQGTQTLSGPMKDLKADLQAKRIIYDGNPIDKWCFANTAVKTDINANIQPVKTDDNRKRIDGTLALLDAYVVLQDKKDDYLAVI